MPERPRLESPCTRVCELIPAGTHCRGCLRTVDEIATWSRMTPAERDAVWRALETRRPDPRFSQEPGRTK